MLDLVIVPKCDRCYSMSGKEVTPAETLKVPRTALKFELCPTCRLEWRPWEKMLLEQGRYDDDKPRTARAAPRQPALPVAAAQLALPAADSGAKVTAEEEEALGVPGHLRVWCQYCDPPSYREKPLSRRAHLVKAHYDLLTPCPVESCKSRVDDIPFHLNANRNSLAHKTYLAEHPQ